MTLYNILKAARCKETANTDFMTVQRARSTAMYKGVTTVIKTITGSLPLTFNSTGANLAEWSLSGNMSQSGTPTPDNPIMPQGTGERTGNLYNINAHDVNNGYVNNAQLNQDGTTKTWGRAEISEYIPISGDTAYTFNGIGSYNSPCYGLYDENKQLIGAYSYNGRSTINFTSPNNARYFRFTRIKTVTQAMTVEGTYTSSTMPEFEPYGYKIPISSANTTTPVYLGEVQTTRKIKKTVLDGTETTWTSGTVQGRMNFNWKTGTQNPNGANVLCTHYKSEYAIHEGVCFITSNNVAFVDSNFQSLDDFKNYLAAQYANGTPVTIWYVLANEETGIVNEPLMKIGDYADTISNAATIPTVSGSNTFDVSTTLKPSEATIKYYSADALRQLNITQGSKTKKKSTRKKGT